MGADNELRFTIESACEYPVLQERWWAFVILSLFESHFNFHSIQEAWQTQYIYFDRYSTTNELTRTTLDLNFSGVTFYEVIWYDKVQKYPNVEQ